MQVPYTPSFAPELDPRHHTAPLERLPEPVAAAGRGGARRRGEPLGRGHRVRARRGARHDPFRPRPRADPGEGRHAARADGLSRARLRRQAHLHDGHADGPQDAPAHPARGRAAAAVPAEGPARRGRRADPRADGRRPRRPAGARRRSRPRRPERRLVHRLPAGLLAGSTCRSRSATTATPPSTAASSSPSPGLYFVGLLFLHSFTSMLIYGTDRDAGRVARHIAGQRASRPEPAEAATIREQVAS